MILCIWVRSRNCGCLVTWFCYQLISKQGNKTAAVSWPDPYVLGILYVTFPWLATVITWSTLGLLWCRHSRVHCPSECWCPCRACGAVPSRAWVPASPAAPPMSADSGGDPWSSTVRGRLHDHRRMGHRTTSRETQETAHYRPSLSVVLSIATTAQPSGSPHPHRE